MYYLNFVEEVKKQEVQKDTEVAKIVDQPQDAMDTSAAPENTVEKDVTMQNEEGLSQESSGREG